MVSQQKQNSFPVHGTPSLGHHDIAATPQSPLSHRTPHSTTSAEIDQFERDIYNESSSHVRAQGTDSLFTWSHLSSFRSSGSLFTDGTLLNIVSESIPDISRNELLRLANRYVDGVHIKNPIVDLSELNHSITHVAENGLDWSTKTCVVALVCSIGALAQKYQQLNTSSPSQVTPRTPNTDSECDVRLSLQFWSVAAKRLALAVGGDGIEAVQCLCLAGIYHMYQMRPLQAWQYFQLAGTAWVARRLTHKQNEEHLNNGDSGSFTLMQSLYFTIWKSECELRIELDVPGPLLDNTDFPDAFPSPPNPDPSSPAHEVAEGERIWYYYLAEIAVRHLINRIMRANYTDKWPPTSKDIRKLLRHADILESQVTEWQESLPPMFQFELPTDSTADIHPDDLTQILRHRYITCRELIARPFVRICLETSPQDLDQRHRARITQLATENVRMCLLKISQATSHLHQGTWFGVRYLATSMLILSAVHKAKANRWSWPQEVILPADWRETSYAAVDVYTPYWNMAAGGLSNIHSLVQKILRDTS